MQVVFACLSSRASGADVPACRLRPGFWYSILMVYEGPTSTPVHDPQPRRSFSRRAQHQGTPHTSSSPPQTSSMPNVLQRARTRSNPSQSAPTNSKPRSVSTSSSNSLPRVPVPVSPPSNPPAVHPGYQHLNTSIGSFHNQSKSGLDAGTVSSIHSSDNQSRGRASSTSSSGHGQGGTSGTMRRSSSRKRPPTPIATGGERGLGVAIDAEPIPLPTKANPNAASVAFPAPTPPFASQGPHQHPPPTPSPTLSARPPHLSSPPGLGEGRTVSSPLSSQSRPKLPSSSTSGLQAIAPTMTQGMTSSTTSATPSSQRRKPSLASPLPPTPLVPPGVSSTPMRSKSFAASNSRTPPAPLNLSTSAAHAGGVSGAVGGAGAGSGNGAGAAGSGHGHGHVRSHYHSLPGPHSPMGGSMMSTSPHTSRPPSRHSPHPSHSQLNSPYAAHGHQPHSHSPLHHPQPRPHTSSSPHPHTSPQIHTQAHHQQRSSLSLSSSPSGLFPQPPALSSSPTNVPDSPSARAMMKRLLAKPAPPSSASGGSVGGTPTSAAMNFGSSPGGGGVGWMSATSGSESEGAYGYSYRRRKDLGRMFGVGDGRSSPALCSPGGAGVGPISPSMGMGVDAGRRQTKGWKSEPEDVGTRRRGRGGLTGEEREPNIAAGIEFDMNLERLDRGIATLGLGVIRGPGYPTGSDGADAASPREKEKEKKTRNVLRRRPSANAGPPSSTHSTSSNAPERSASANALSQIARAQIQQLQQAQLQPPAPTVLLPPTSPLSPISFSIANRNSPSQPSQPSFEMLQMQGLRPPVASSSMSRSSSRSREGEGSGRSRGSSPVRSPVVSTIHGSGPGSGSATPVERKRSREERLERKGSKDGKLERKGSKEREKERGLQRKLSKDRKDGNERTKSLTPAASLIEQYKARQATREEEERRVREALEREAEAERARDQERWERERAVERAAEREEKERIRALERERAMERNERERRADWERGMGHQRKRSRSHPAAFSSMSTAPVTTNTSPFSSNGHVKAKTSLSNFQGSYAGTNSIYTHLNSNISNSKRRTTSDRLAPEHDAEAEASDSGVSHLQLARRGGTPAPEAVLGGGRGFESIERIAGLEEHERRVEEMVRGSNSGTVDKDDTKPNASERRSSQNPPREGMEDQPAGPYYTVFGSTSGRVVAVGSVEDSWDAYGRLGYWDSGTFGRKGAGSIKEKERDRQSEKGEKSKGLGRTLSRKVSERWRRPGTGNAAGPVVVPASVMSDDGHGSHREDVERERQGLSLAGRLPRASMQERRVPVRREEDLEMGQERQKREKMKNRRSLRLSIDKFSDVVDREEEKDGVPLTRTLSKQKSGSAMKNEASSPGGAGAGPSRLWKLMRRISVGGLREKYQDPEAPPVPALPHHIREATLSNDSLKLPPRKAPSSGSTSPTPVRQSPTAASSSRPSPPQSKSNSAPAPVQPRPSTTTRSSSPVSSSDVASSKFFNRTHSTRSSTSSLGEEVPPPVPKAPSSVLMQKIIPPSKMDEISKEYGGASSPPTLQIPMPPYPSLDDDWAIVDTPAVELPSLTLPPRRPQQGFLGVAGSSSSLKPPAVSPLVPTSAGTAAFGRDEEDATNLGRSESPTIPLFSTRNTVDTGPAKRLSASLSAKSKSSPISPHPQSPSSTNAFTIPVPVPTSPTSLPPPPRPLRSAQRPPPGSTAPHPTTTEQPVSEPTRSFPSPSSSIKRNRRSSGGTSTISNATARPHRRSRSIGMSRSFDISRSNAHLSSSSASIISSYASIRSGTSTLDLESAMEMDRRAAFTFRELGSSDGAGRRALTEQEKAARWDDLLERSDRAGGTLHLGGEGRLASDRLRF
ncbi:unnamed protein product [Cyclocybe aegerita]|uniref:Uncharacterized protein n=1 Tax=Cyclocybe aegerita TaxID=1973307 RepID=A0A8S0XRW9_CYCAE|nr:unnamed protein product [Cyclocybe aegerita]